MRKVLVLLLLPCCVDYQPNPPPVCLSQEVYQYGDGGEVVATGDWATLCRCPEAVPFPRNDRIECLRCKRHDRTHYKAPGGCWEP
jgi:hypothetical protein